MDWLSLISALSSDLSSVVIAGLAFAYWQERKQSRLRETDLIESRFKRDREHSEQLIATMQAVSDATRALEARK